MTKNHVRVKKITFVGVMAALLCVFAPMSIPIGPVPISLTGFFVCLSVVLLGSRFTLAVYGIYLFIGCLGLPVFSGWQGGVGVLLGPTGGYLAGFLLWIIAFGVFYQQKKLLFTVLGAIFGTLLLYLFGTLWFMFVTKSGLWTALTLCVFPFLIPDFIKIFLACKIGKRLPHL